MKKLFVHPAIRTYRYPLFDRLGEQGFDFLFTAKGDPKTHIGEEIGRLLSEFPHPYVQGRELAGLPFSNLSFDLVRTLRYDVVIFSGLTSMPFLLFAPLLKKLGKKVFLFDETWYFQQEIPVYHRMRPYVSYLLKNCVDGVIVAGSKAKEMYVGDFHFPPEKISVAFNTTVDPSEWESPPETKKLRAEFRRRFGGQRILLYLGRVVEYKGLDLLVEAVSRLENPAALVVVGDGPFRQKCEALAHQLLPPDRFAFLGGCPSREAIHYYRASDIFVLPTRFLPSEKVNCESWGFTVNEAILAGVPVVATTAVGAAHDLIVDGKTGMIAQAGNADSLAEKIDHLLSDETLRKQTVQRAKRRLRSLCDYDQNLEAFQSTLNYALDGKKLGL